MLFPSKKYDWKKRLTSALEKKLYPQVCPPICGPKTPEKWTFDYRLDPWRKTRTKWGKEKLRESVSKLFEIPKTITEPIRIKLPEPRRSPSPPPPPPPPPPPTPAPSRSAPNKKALAVLGGLALLGLLMSSGGKK